MNFIVARVCDFKVERHRKSCITTKNVDSSPHKPASLLGLAAISLQFSDHSGWQDLKVRTMSTAKAFLSIWGC